MILFGLLRQNIKFRPSRYWGKTARQRLSPIAQRIKKRRDNLLLVVSEQTEYDIQGLALFSSGVMQTHTVKPTH